MEQHADGMWRLREQPERLPLQFAISAHKVWGPRIPHRTPLATCHFWGVAWALEGPRKVWGTGWCSGWLRRAWGGGQAWLAAQGL